jgi:hypothetical protein
MLRKPVVLDGWFHVAFAIFYTIVGSAGMAGAIYSIPSLQRTTDVLFAALAAGFLGITCYISGALALIQRPWAQEAEVYTGLAAAMALGLLAFGLFTQLIVTSEQGRLYISIFALGHIVFPLFRSAYIAIKLREVRKAAEKLRHVDAQIKRLEKGTPQ